MVWSAFRGGERGQPAGDLILVLVNHRFVLERKRFVAGRFVLVAGRLRNRGSRAPESRLGEVGVQRWVRVVWAVNAVGYARFGSRRREGKGDGGRGGCLGRWATRDLEQKPA